jgi:PAS domain S-box-containing protein
LKSEAEFRRRNVRGKNASTSVRKERSKRKPASAELKKQRLTMEAIINSAKEPIFSVDGRYCYTSFNKAHASVMKTIYGKEVEIGGNLLDYMTVNEDREKAKRNLDRALTGKGFVEVAYSGEEARSRLLFEVSHSPITAKDGAIIGVAVVAKDVTERKRLEETYRTLVENSLQGLAVFQDNHWVFANQALLEMSGYSLEELRSRSQDDVLAAVHPKDRERVRGHIQDLLTDQPASPRLEFRLSKKDGTMIWVETLASQIQYHGRPAVKVAYADITERKRVEAKLRQSEERYRSLFDRMLDGVYRSTHEGRFVDISPALVKMFGYSSRQEMLSIKDIKKELYFQPEERGSHVLDTGKEEVEAYRMRRKDGSEVWVEDHGHYVHDEQGNVVFHEGILRDITERRKMEAELEKHTRHLENLVEERTRRLRESELELRSTKERLEYVIQSNPAVIYSGKPLPDLSDWELTFVSDRVVTMLGYEPREFVGHPEFWTSHVHPHGLQANPEVVQTLWRNGHHTFEYQFHHKDGSYRWIREEASASRDSNGKPIEVHGYWTDVTELKQAEQSLIESERRYRELFEALPISLWEEDFSPVKGYFDGLRSKGIVDFRQYLNEHPDEVAKCFGTVKVLSVNDATLRLYGARTIEDLAHGLSSVFSDESRDVYRDEILAFAEGRTRFTSEIHNRTLRGETKNISLICNVVPGYEKNLARVLVCIVDLTPQRVLEKELRSTRSQLEHVLATNPAVLFLEQPLPDLSNTITTFVSESAMSVLGFEPKNFLGESGLDFWRSRIHQDDLARYLAEMPSLWRDGHHVFEYRFLHSDGNYRWIREEYRVIRDAEGHILDAVGVATDVTERTKLEEKLAEAERLAAIGQTAAMVGHDLRNPLQGIAGAIYLLRQQNESPPADEREHAAKSGALELLGMVEESVDYMDKIVSDLRDYAAPANPELATVSINQLLNETLSNMRIPSNVKVSVNVQDAEKWTVDPVLMRRVFINLITNAVQAMPNGGELKITTQKTQDETLVTFQDTGTGILKEDLPQLFQPFHTTKAKGQGLGLAVCKRLVEAHGGKITVISTVGEGSTFTVTVPNKTSQENESPVDQEVL